MNVRMRRKVVLIAAGVAIVASLTWLVTNQGPLAPAKVTVAKVERSALVASTFGIGTVEARRAYALGSTVPSRVLRVLVDQGDRVKAGQLIAELDPVDLDDRMASGALAVERPAACCFGANGSRLPAGSGVVNESEWQKHHAASGSLAELVRLDLQVGSVDVPSDHVRALQSFPRGDV